MSPFETVIDDSLVQAFDEGRVIEYESLIFQKPDHKFEQVFLDFLRRHYGVTLSDCWVKDVEGNELRVQRVLTYEDRDSLPGAIQPSWRGSPDDERLEYSVLYLESSYPNWEDHDKLIPFAGIDCEEMSQFDMLCLDYREEGRPSVVVWIAEESMGYASPKTDPVADDFDEFLSRVYMKNNPNTSAGLNA